MEDVNDSLGESTKPFSILGAFKESIPKNFWMKARCCYYQDLLNLCLPKKNLKSNLRQHLASSKHLHAVEQSKIVTKQ